MSNVQSTWLSRKLKASVQINVADSIVVFQEEYLKGSLSLTPWHPQRPRGGQSGRDKWRRKFSRMSERAPWMLLWTNQFYDSFEYLSFGGQHLSRCFLDPVIRRSLPTNLTFHCTCLARAGELSKLDTGITILSYSTYQFKSLKDRLLSILDRHVQEIILHSLKFVNISYQSPKRIKWKQHNRCWPPIGHKNIKHLNELWNWFVKSSILEALLSVLENFCRHVSWPNWHSLASDDDTLTDWLWGFFRMKLLQ